MVNNPYSIPEDVAYKIVNELIAVLQTHKVDLDADIIQVVDDALSFKSGVEKLLDKKMM